MTGFSAEEDAAAESSPSCKRSAVTFYGGRGAGLEAIVQPMQQTRQQLEERALLRPRLAPIRAWLLQAAGHN